MGLQLLPHLRQIHVSGRHRLPESHLAKEEAFGAEQRRGATAGRTHWAALGQVGVEARGDAVPAGQLRRALRGRTVDQQGHAGHGPGQKGLHDAFIASRAVTKVVRSDHQAHARAGHGLLGPPLELPGEWTGQPRPRPWTLPMPRPDAHAQARLRFAFVLAT